MGDAVDPLWLNPFPLENGEIIVVISSRFLREFVEQIAAMLWVVEPRDNGSEIAGEMAGVAVVVIREIAQSGLWIRQCAIPDGLKIGVLCRPMPE